MECNGYCPSDTFFYNEEEINSVSCCSITNLKLKELKITCAKKIYFSYDNQISSLHSNKKDRELFQEFLKSLKASKWTYVSNQRKNTTGFYTVYLPSSASCECTEMGDQS